jgi:hypothetical protein
MRFPIDTHGARNLQGICEKFAHHGQANFMTILPACLPCDHPQEYQAIAVLLMLIVRALRDDLFG